MSVTEMPPSPERAASTVETGGELNPYLARFSTRMPDRSAGPGQQLESGERELIRWQTRPAVPSEYELRLAAALERIFTQEIYELADIVAALNREDVRTPSGASWSASGFEQTMRELGKLVIG